MGWRCQSEKRRLIRFLQKRVSAAADTPPRRILRRSENVTYGLVWTWDRSSIVDDPEKQEGRSGSVLDLFWICSGPVFGVFEVRSTGGSQFKSLFNSYLGQKWRAITGSYGCLCT